jgi:hypothetical protein
MFVLHALALGLGKGARTTVFVLRVEVMPEFFLLDVICLAHTYNKWSRYALYLWLNLSWE